MSYPACPQCSENYTYEDGHLLVCPMCGYEWTQESEDLKAEAAIIRDVNGNELADGDDVTVVKDLKVGGSVIKQGTRVKNIRLLADVVDDHDILARVDGMGSMYLKSSVVKK
ncbi:MAG TPA: alkylphosphonate utilization protein [Erysipelothrix sp.]|nr:alkylphosphonate utilization protein [Erysipelothrix sp.]